MTENTTFTFYRLFKSLDEREKSKALGYMAAMFSTWDIKRIMDAMQEPELKQAADYIRDVIAARPANRQCLHIVTNQDDADDTGKESE